MVPDGAEAGSPYPGEFVVPHLKFGSPFDHDPQHPHDVEMLAPSVSVPLGAGDDVLPPRPHEVVVWEGLSERDLSDLDQNMHEHLHDHEVEEPANVKPDCAKRLGKVTFYIRGKGDTSYSHRTATLTNEGLLIAEPQLSSSPRNTVCEGPVWDEADDGTPEDEHNPMTLQRWLSVVRSECSRKLPLPKQWFALPSPELRQLAEERGFIGDGSDSRISVVKFLRDFDKEHSVK